MLSTDVKIQARQLYIEGLNLSEIATELGINAKTASAWKKDMGDWDKMRAVYAGATTENMAHSFLAKIIYEFDEAIKQAYADPDFSPIERAKLLCDLSDSFARAVNANKKLMPNVDKFQIMLDTVAGIGETIKTHAPEILDKYIECTQIHLQ